MRGTTLLFILLSVGKLAFSELRQPICNDPSPRALTIFGTGDRVRECVVARAEYKTDAYSVENRYLGFITETQHFERAHHRFCLSKHLGEDSPAMTYQHKEAFEMVKGAR